MYKQTTDRPYGYPIEFYTVGDTEITLEIARQVAERFGGHVCDDEVQRVDTEDEEFPFYYSFAVIGADRRPNTADEEFFSTLDLEWEPGD